MVKDRGVPGKPISRRAFTATASTLGAGIVAGTSVGANERIRCGVIGVGNRGTYLLQLALQNDAVAIASVCDIQPAHLARAQEIVAKSGQPRPAGFGERGPLDYRRLLEQKDLDAVIVATPMQDHGQMALDALRAGKAVLSEVAACMTLDECWGLVKAVQETGKLYMLAENVCYFRDCMAVRQMVQKGVFGGFTYAECGYVHDCRFLHFEPDGSLSWRGRLACDYIGNLYPTHAIGPVAQWLGINRTDRFVSLVSVSSRSFGPRANAIRKFGPASAQAKTPFQKGDSNTTLIQTANGVVIDLRYDTSSARPHRTTCYHGLQGEKGAYQSVTNEVWVEGRSKGYQWEPFAPYLGAFDDPLWKEFGNQAKSTGHGGADFFVVKEFFDALRTGKQPPIDVYDAVTWSAIIPLSAESIRKGHASVAVPDFKPLAKAGNRTAAGKQTADARQ